MPRDTFKGNTGLFQKPQGILFIYNVGYLKKARPRVLHILSDKNYFQNLLYTLLCFAKRRNYTHAKKETDKKDHAKQDFERKKPQSLVIFQFSEITPPCSLALFTTLGFHAMLMPVGEIAIG